MKKPSQTRKRKPQPGAQAQRPSAGAQTNAPPDPFAAFRGRAEALAAGDEAGLKALLSDLAREKYSEARADPIIRAAAKATGIAFKLVKGLLARATAELKRREESAPAARQAKLIVLQTERDVELARLWASCGSLATSETLLRDMERLVHRMGLVGEGAAIRGTYIAGSSRLLRRLAISFLRRGAAASGKNIQINKVLSLFPPESVIIISSATPQALIYEGEDENDIDALKHKIIVIGEAAVLARKANGDEHPMVPMLRTMLADGHLDHRIPVPQQGAPPKTVHIRRDGPMSLLLTSARSDIEDEMMTRLLTSDANESERQTKRIVLKTWRGRRETAVSPDDIRQWVDFQKWLEIDKPPDGYEVVIPFADAIAKGHLELMQKNRSALQLRTRRDAAAFKAAIEACAVIHKAQRQVDGDGRIVATLEDYEQAHSAFDVGMASLYGIRQSGAIDAALRAVIAIADRQAAPTRHQPHMSYKVTLEVLRHELGLASKSAALARLIRLLDLGMIEEDEEKRGRGKGSPRYYEIKNESFSAELDNVFPSVAAVRKIIAGGGFGRTRRTRSQPVDPSGVSCSSGHPPEKKQEGFDQQKHTGEAEASRPFSGGCLDEQEDPNNSTAYPLVRLVQSTPFPSSLRAGAKKRGNARKSSDLTATERIASVRGAGGTLTLWPDGTGFDTDLRSVADAMIAGLLQEVVSDNYEAILAALRREAGLDREQAEGRP